MEHKRMTEPCFDNLTREELLSLVHNQQLQIAQLQRQLTRASAGSLAQAALELNGVFHASQQAADAYLQSVEDLKSRQETEYTLRLAQAEAQSREMVTQAEASAQFYWDALNRRIEAFMATQPLLHAESTGSADEPAEESFGPDD